MDASRGARQAWFAQIALIRIHSLARRSSPFSSFLWPLALLPNATRSSVPFIVCRSLASVAFDARSLLPIAASLMIRGQVLASRS